MFRLLPLGLLCLALFPPTISFASEGDLDAQGDWDQRELEVTAVTGTSGFFAASFDFETEVKNEDLSALNVWIAPGLARFLSGSVNGPLRSGEIDHHFTTTSVNFTASFPLDTKPRQYRGLAILRDGDRPIGRPLLIRVDLKEPSLNEIPVGSALPSEDRVTFDPAIGASYIQSEIIVALEDGADTDALIQLVNNFGGRFYGSIPTLKFYQLVFPDVSDPNQLDLIADQLRESPIVSSAARSWVYEGSRTPDPTSDPFFAVDPWNENDPDGPNAPLEYTKFPSAWEFFPAATWTSVGNPDLRIAVIDTGFDADHEDLIANVRTSDFRDLPNVHGTAVAGTLAATGNNAVGITGATWSADLLLYSCGIPSRNADSLRIGMFCILESIEDAVSSGARIVNVSAGRASAAQVLRPDEILMFRRAIARGGDRVLFVFSAGNPKDFLSNLTPDFPAVLSATTSNVISVTGIESVPSTFVPRPDLLGKGLTVDVAAPGLVLTTVPAAFNPLLYDVRAGSSFATPLVSGLAALLLSYDDTLTAPRIKQLIIQGAEEGEPGVGGIQVAGEDFFVINAGRSMELAAASQIGIEQLNNENCSSYGVCGVDIAFGPSIDFSQTYLEIDWGDSSSLSRVSVEACLASGDCQDMGDGRVRVWKAYAAPAAYGASIRYALGDGIWRDVGVGFSVSEVNSLSLSANPGDGTATLVWQDLGADRYNLCQANEPVDVFDNCSVYSGGVFAISVGSPPWLVSGLTNGNTYHFRLEALFGNARLISSPASAIPQAASWASNQECGTDFHGVSNSYGGNTGFGPNPAFAALKADGTIAVWGSPNVVTGAPRDAGYVSVTPSYHAFAALKADGQITAWGELSFGSRAGDQWRSAIEGAPSDNGYTSVSANAGAFAALKSDGSITTWGHSGAGGAGGPSDSGYVSIVSTGQAFAALNADGSIYSWGDVSYGAGGAPSDTGYVYIATKKNGNFAALKDDGTVVTWGPNSDRFNTPLDSGHTSIYTDGSNFVALKTDGRLVSWPLSSVTGDLPTGPGHVSVVPHSNGGGGYAALKDDGSIVAWGPYGAGFPTDPGYVNVVSSYGAFAALRSDGSIAVWGPWHGSFIPPPADSGYISITTSLFAFAALKDDGSVSVFGSPTDGGIDGPIGTGYVSIASTQGAFAALHADGTIVSWGAPDLGGAGAPTDGGYVSINGVGPDTPANCTFSLKNPPSGPVAQLSPEDVNFGSTGLGDVAVKRITLQSAGNEPLQVGSVSLDGNISEFSVDRTP